MTSELVSELQNVGLQLKPDALCFLTTSKDDDRTVPLTVPLPVARTQDEPGELDPAVPASESAERHVVVPGSESAEAAGSFSRPVGNPQAGE
eukprot:2376296-Alexandrium_andersonii.AAC.1